MTIAKFSQYTFPLAPNFFSFLVFSCPFFSAAYQKKVLMNLFCSPLPCSRFILFRLPPPCPFSPTHFFWQTPFRNFDQPLIFPLRLLTRPFFCQPLGAISCPAYFNTLFGHIHFAGDLLPLVPPFDPFSLRMPDFELPGGVTLLTHLFHWSFFSPMTDATLLPLCTKNLP